MFATFQWGIFERNTCRRVDWLKIPFNYLINSQVQPGIRQCILLYYIRWLR